MGLRTPVGWWAGGPPHARPHTTPSAPRSAPPPLPPPRPHTPPAVAGTQFYAWETSQPPFLRRQATPRHAAARLELPLHAAPRSGVATPSEGATIARGEGAVADLRMKRVAWSFPFISPWLLICCVLKFAVPFLRGSSSSQGQAGAAVRAFETMPRRCAMAAGEP